MPIGSWGRSVHSSDKEKEVLELGSWLSLAIDCPVHYPAYEENMFECSCGLTFPTFLVRYKNLKAVQDRHVRVT